VSDRAAHGLRYRRDESERRLTSYLDECRELVLAEIEHIIPSRRSRTGGLYDLMLDYPLRPGKALRPALCIATCRALGGQLESVTRSAAVLELYHNAFLIHDDVEDGSMKRRQEETLHRKHGVPVAVNVGDGMLALTMKPLLENMELIGVGPALRILSIVADMARESAEGQALELEWIQTSNWSLHDRDYFWMVVKKSAWYSFIVPVAVGAIAAGYADTAARRLRLFAKRVGVAFQIQDDVLNLTAEGSGYGKESSGDLWEGKRTLILLHALRSATAGERERAVEILRRSRPREPEPAPASFGREVTAGAWHSSVPSTLSREKSAADVGFLLQLIDRYGSLRYASDVAMRWARLAVAALDSVGTSLPDSVHRNFLYAVADYVIQRDR
jgi:geranylgeranyl diphosphate synthase type II